MERRKNWIFLLCFVWTIMRCATLDHGSVLDSTIKEFGARLKKLNSNPYVPRKNTLAENTIKKVNRAGHELPMLPLSKEAIGQKRNFTHNPTGLQTYFKTPSTSKKNFFQNNKKLILNDTDVSDEKPSLALSQNLHFNKIEPFWPFSNLTASFLDHGFIKPEDQNHGFPYSSLPDRFKDTTFFFSHVGPNRFEYRAQFHHNNEKFHQPKDFKPFVHEFPEFPKLHFPPFPSYPETPELFHQLPRYPSFPEFNPFSFPTLPPPVKRNLGNNLEPKVPENNEHNRFEGPFNHYDVVLGDSRSKYPKIFRFNEERINIADFEKQKKRQAKANGLNHNLVQPENVQRNHLLILHGGIFTVKEPPAYQRKVIRKRRQRFRDIKRIGKI